VQRQQSVSKAGTAGFAPLLAAANQDPASSSSAGLSHPVTPKPQEFLVIPQRMELTNGDALRMSKDASTYDIQSESLERHTRY